VSDLDFMLASVEQRGPSMVPQPDAGEPLPDYAVRCMKIGALLSVESAAAITLANSNRLAREAMSRLSAETTPDVPTVGTTDEGTTA
jgi:hypothetical protein